MRLWTSILLIALVVLLAAPASANHSTADNVEIAVGEELQLLAGTNDAYSYEADDPAKILEFRTQGLALFAKCLRTGPPAIVKIRYSFAGSVHTHTVTIACKRRTDD